MPQAAPRNIAVAARGWLALICVGFLWLLNSWLFAAGVAVLVIARAACGARCPGILVLAAMSVAVAALALALASSVAMLLLCRCVLDPGAREHMAAATREALDVGSTVAQLGRLAAAAFLSIGILALAVKVYPPLKGYERICSAALDAVALCASALCCFIVIPTFAIRMWRRI